MHRLGDVGRGKVDHDGAGMLGSGNSAGWIGQEALELLRDPVVIQAQVEEARAGHFGRRGDRGEVDAAGDLLGEVAGLLAERLGEHHAAVGLVIAELGVGRGADRGGEGGAVGSLGQGRNEELTQACQ